MTTVTIDEELQTRLQAVAPDEDLDGLVRAALQDYIERRPAGPIGAKRLPDRPF